MSEIKRYTIISNEETDWDYFEMDGGNWCLYDDVAPIIKRNLELETENSVQRLQIEHLEADIAHFVGSEQSAVSQLYDALKELTRLREQKPAAYKLPVYPVRIVEHSDLNGCYADGTVESLYAEPKPAQMPAALIEWANLSEYEPTQWHKGYEAARRWVKMQLDTMKGGV